jgi:fatty acid desaturase
VTEEPPITTAARTRTQTPPVSEYSELKRILTAAGLRAAQPRFYVTKAIANAAALTGVILLALWSPHPAVLVASAVLFGVMLTQNGLLGHDLAHRQIFRRGRGVTIGGWILGNLLLGVSYTWWTRKHNLHHANPNHIDDDPDVNYAILAFFPEQASRRARWAQPIIRIQAFLLPFLAMFAFVSLRAPSFSHLRERETPHRVLQAAGILLHWTLFGLLLGQLGGWPQALTYLVVSQVTFGLYNVSVFAPNHKGMKMLSDDEQLDFLRTQVLTSRNVRGGRFTDLWYGGLNYQIEHHLFPTMPRNQLSKAQPIVEEFCRSRGIPYHETSLSGSYVEIFRQLRVAGAAA